MTTPATKSVVVERDFPHSPAKLWRALTQPHLIAEWLIKSDFAPVVGHRFNMTGEWGGTLDCQVMEVTPDRELSYTWDFVHTDPAFDLRSIVTFTLTPIPNGTRLRMEQAGFRPDQPQAYGGARQGWAANLDKLLATLDRME
jgi:uncharacterized protein YndB with AHSA1/START domain